MQRQQERQGRLPSRDIASNEAALTVSGRLQMADPYSRWLDLSGVSHLPVNTCQGSYFFLIYQSTVSSYLYHRRAASVAVRVIQTPWHTSIDPVHFTRNIDAPSAY